MRATMPIVEEASPILDHPDDAKPNRFSFVLVEKSSGGDKHKAVATIRSHTMKRLHEQRRALDRRAKREHARRQFIVSGSLSKTEVSTSPPNFFRRFPHPLLP